jgi:hypothetical protein
VIKIRRWKKRSTRVNRFYTVWVTETVSLNKLQTNNKWECEILIKNWWTMKRSFMNSLYCHNIFSTFSWQKHRMVYKRRYSLQESNNTEAAWMLQITLESLVSLTLNTEAQSRVLYRICSVMSVLVECGEISLPAISDSTAVTLTTTLQHGVGYVWMALFKRHLTMSSYR